MVSKRSRPSWPSSAVSTKNPALRNPIAVTSRMEGSSSISRIVASTGGSMPAGPSRPGPSAGLRRRAAGGQSEMVASVLEEQLAVLRQRPEVVGDERLELVDDLAQARPAPG